MKLKDSLTILIPLWGRNYATKRILAQMSQDGVPFKILFADGSGEDNSKWINEYGGSGNLDIDYHNYGPDDSIHKFMRKMDLACSRITTPLTVMIDNDDLFSLEGLIYGVNFLCNNDDYASFKENIQNGKRGGPIYTMNSIVAENPAQRIVDLFEEGRSNGGINSEWHAICRTHILSKMFKIIHQSKNEDFQLSHTVNKFWNLFFGKSHKGYSRSYVYHIAGDSLVQGNSLYSKYKDWIHDAKFKNSMTIIASMIGCIFQHYDPELVTGIQELIIKDPYHLGRHTVDCDVVNSILQDAHEYNLLINTILQEPCQTPKIFRLNGETHQ